ncbi:TPA: site-specific DNA-methyltransferase [Enterococcus faecalis]
MEINKIYNQDCLEGMKRIPEKSIDMILCDLPYGTTSCSWDIIIPFDALWEQYNRVIKDNSAIVLFSSQPFTSRLVSSNLRNYKYDWIWNKKSISNPQLAKFQPLKNFEVISVFGNGTTPRYFPQDLVKVYIDKKTRKTKNEKLNHIKRRDYTQEFTNYPKALSLNFPRESNVFHPTQKPVALFEYLIKTYTNKGDLVLDNCMGSGTTAIACLNTDRDFIGFETNVDYFEKSLQRIEENVTQTNLFEQN